MAKGVRGREEGVGAIDPKGSFNVPEVKDGNGGGIDPSMVHDVGTLPGEAPESPVVTAPTATKGRTEAEKAEAFSRLASIRASNALDAMRGISHLANAKQYAFTREQVDKMLGALQDSVDALWKGFEVALEQAERPPPSDGRTPGRKKRGARQNFSIRV